MKGRGKTMKFLKLPLASVALAVCLLALCAVSASADTTFTKYNLTTDQLVKIARLCYQEQGSVTGAKAEASLMANQLESSPYRQKTYGTGANGLYNWVRNGGWFANAAYYMDNGSASTAVIEGVRDVLVYGNRTLPWYVDEHDCLSDIKKISTGNNVYDKSSYISGQTIVNNKYGSTWTFWSFPTSASDPFGYTAAAYNYLKGKAYPDQEETDCDCSPSYAGYYECTTTTANLIIRKGHSKNADFDSSIPPGATVYVSRGNGEWAHVTYNGHSGYASMEFLRRKNESTLTLPTTRTCNDGIYSIRAAVNTQYCLGVDNDSNDNGVNIQLWQYYDDNDYEHWEFTYLGSGLYSVRNVGSSRFLDVSEYGQGTNVVQYDYNGPTDNEKWYVVTADAGTFLVPYCNTAKALDIDNGIMENGTNIHLWDQTQGYTQKVTLSLRPQKTSLLTLPMSRNYDDGVYSIRAAVNTQYCLGVDNDSNDNGVNIQLWQYYEDNAYEHWRFTYLGSGLYSIKNTGSGRFLDVSEYGQGTNVVQYNYNGPTDNEKWYIVLDNAGTFLVPYCNTVKALDIDNGVMENGTNIHLWDQTLGGTQTVTLIRQRESSGITLPTSRTCADGVYSIRAAVNTQYSLGVDNDSNDNGVNIQLWQYYEDNDYEHWQFTYLGSGLYSIRNVGSDRFLDVSEYGQGTNVVQYNYNGPTDNEKWYVVRDGSVTFLVPYCNTSKALDIDNGIMTNGTNIHLWDQTWGDTQRVTLMQRPQKTSRVTLPTSRTVGDGTYGICSSIDSTYALTVDGDSNANGVSIQLWQYFSTNDYENWNVKYLGSGLYSICNVGSGKFLDVSEYGRGTDIVQYNDNGPTDNEKWYIVQDGGEYFLIPYCNISMALDIHNGIMENGTYIHLYNQTLGSTQRMLLLPRKVSFLDYFTDVIFHLFTVSSGEGSGAGSSNEDTFILLDNPAGGVSDQGMYLTLNDTVLVKDEDFTVDSLTLTNNNMAIVTVTGIGAYCGTVNTVISLSGDAGTVTITFDANGGTMDTPNLVIEKGTSVSSLPVPTMTGSQFVGWFTAPTGGDAVDAGYVANSDITLYARWATNYTVTYDGNGGSGTPEPQTKTEGIDLTLSAVSPVWPGCLFRGWSLTKGGAPVYQPGSEYTGNASVTLYASWEVVPDSERINTVIDQITVTDNVLHVYGWAYDVTCPSESLTIEIGHSNAAGSDIRTCVTDSYRIDVNEAYGIEGVHGIDFTGSFDLSGTYTLTLYAYPVNSPVRRQIYTGSVAYGQTYTVHYDINGGEGVPEPQIKTKNVTLTLSTVCPVRPGYLFQGWSVSKDGAAVYQPGDEYTANDSVTLYASWQAVANSERVSAFIDQVTVTDNVLSINGWAYDITYPSEPLEIIIQHHNSQETTVTYCVTDSHRIDVNAAFGIDGLHGIDYHETMNLNGTYTLTIFARSVDSDSMKQIYSGQVEYVRTYTLSYDANGGEGAPNVQTWVTGQSAVISSTAPIRFGYRFKGWSTSATSSSASFQPGIVWPLDIDVTLYAVWEEANVLRLPADLKSVDQEAFSGSGAVFVIIPDGCQAIDSRAFANCRNLLGIRIPASVTSIAGDAFLGTTGIVIYTTSQARTVINYAMNRNISLSVENQ